MFVVRYPSNLSPGKMVYAEGEGSSDDPCVCLINLPMSGKYVLYASYVGENDGGISYKASVRPLLLEDWFPILDSSDGSVKVVGFNTSDDISDNQAFRIPYLSENSDNCIAASERHLKLEIYANDYDETTNGSMVINVVNAIRPVDIPFITDGTIDPKVGSLNITISGGASAQWKIYHGDSFLNSGVTLNNIGVGKQLVEIKNGLSEPFDYHYHFFDVSLNTVSSYTVTIGE